MFNHPRIHYRADIDGLRGIAVLSVVLFHYLPGLFPGGFFGVDSFFVISGFLITKQLLLNQKMNFLEVKEFYKRRVLRILPMLTLVVGLSLVVGWFILLSHEYKALGLESAISSIFGTNFYLMAEDNYFATSSKFRPLFHLWSLAIEEQFYLVWPILVSLVLRLKWNLRIFTSGLAIFSLVGAFVFIYVFFDDVYFETYFRVWPILLGALIAQMDQPLDLNESLKKYLIAILFLLLVGCNFLISEMNPWPGFWALLPVLATSMIILLQASEAQMDFFKRFGLVHIGKISFSLYLWHWVILSFASILFGGSLSLLPTIIFIFISFFFSQLTYQWVEQPIRKSGNPFWVIFAFCTVGLVGFGVYKQNGFPHRHPAEVNLLSVRQPPRLLENFEDCTKKYADINFGLCATKNYRSAVLLGDSHAWHLHHGFVNSKNSFFAHTELLAASSCWPAWGQATIPECQPFVNQVISDLVQRSPAPLVIISFWGAMADQKSGFNYNALIQGIFATIDKLLNSGSRVVLLVDSLGFTGSIESCYKPPIAIRGLFLQDYEWCQGRSSDDLDRPNYTKLVAEAQKRYSKDRQFLLLSVVESLCKNSHCPIQDQETGLLLYTDDQHLSIYGSSKVADDIIEKIRKHWKDL